MPVDCGCSTQARRNMMVVFFVGVSSAFEGAFVILQAYYLLLNGMSSLYGFTAGAYEIGQFMFSPLFGWVASKWGYKWLLVAGSLVSLLANGLFASLYAIQNSSSNDDLGWQLMIVSRVFIGIGATTINTGLAYISTHTTPAQQYSHLGTYRGLVSATTIAGPLLVYSGIAIETPDLGAGPTDTSYVFNFYTMAGWYAVILNAICILLLLCLFKDIPDIHDEQSGDVKQTISLELSKTTGSDDINKEERIQKRVPVTWALVINFVVGFAEFGLYSVAFGVSVASYKLVTSQSDVWIPYVTVGVGSIAALIIWGVFSKLGFKNEKSWNSFSLIALMAFPLFWIQYEPGAYQQLAAMFIIGSVLAGFSLVIWFGTNEIIFSKLLAHIGAGKSTATFLGYYNAAYNLARFVGPLVVGGTLTVEENCDTENTCCFSGSSYEIEGCKLNNAEVVIPIIAVITILAGLANFYYIYKVADYPVNFEPEQEKDAKLSKAISQATTSPRLSESNEVVQVQIV